MRFPEFKNQWELVKLKDISTSLKSGLSRMFSSLNIGIPVIRANNVKQDKFYNSDLKYWYKNDPQGAKTETYLVKAGDVLINFINSSAQIGTSCIYNGELKEDCIYTTNILRFRLTNNLNNYFFQQYTNHKNYKNYIRSIEKPAVNQSSFTTVDFLNMHLFIPSSNEQVKIATFLKIINTRIETQNKIIDKLESLKIQLKEQIYNLGKNKLKISAILEENSKKSVIQDQYPVLSSTVKGLFLQSDYFDREIASSNNIGYKVVKKRQIIISPQNLWMGNITLNDSFEHGIVSPSYKVFDIKGNYSEKYIYWLLTSRHSFFNYSLVSEQGASIVRRNLNFESFLNITLPICNEEQQKHISELISSFELKLEVEKRKLELFIKQKSFLLSNLFI